MKMKFLLVLVLLLSSVSVIAVAQEDTVTAQDYLARYEGIPFERLEDGGFVLGDPAAPITIVEFADFLCSHCQTYQETAHQFIDTYVKSGQARFEYRLFPVVDPTYSAYGAQLAECANTQQDGLFWPAHDYLYDLGIARNIGPNTAEDMAALFGLDLDALTTCTESAQQYLTDQALGESLSVSGTPATRLRVGEQIGVVRIADQTLSGGGIPLELLDLIITTEDPASLLVVPETPLREIIEPDATCAEIITGCWRGLVLGETLWEDAVVFIKGQPQFTDLQEVDDTEQNLKAVVWRGLASEIQDFNQAVSIGGETLDFVAVIDLSPYTAGDVLETYGDPSYALANPLEEGFTFAYLFYPQKSLIVQVYVLEEQGGLTAESQLVGAQFNTAERMEELLASITPVEWQGFEGFESYIQE